MRLVVTGGHLTPALAFLQECRLHKDSILFFGRRFSSEANRIESHEKSEAETLGASFVTITSAKLNRLMRARSLFLAPKLAVGVTQALVHLASFKPDVVVTFGGYLAVPVAIAARMLKIPIITHEQTRGAGLANEVISRWAKKAALSWPESSRYFPKEKTVVIGNLVRREFFEESEGQRPSWFEGMTSERVLTITGGNQGSQTINRVVAESLSELTKRYQIVHQCGGVGSDFFDFLSHKRLLLPSERREKYLVRSWFSSAEMAWLFRRSHLIIARAGANTVSEVMAVGAPTLFIPLPHAYRNEQLINAQSAVRGGAGRVLEQKRLSKEVLLEEITNIGRNYRSYGLAARKLKKNINPQAAAELYDLVLKYAKKKA